MRPEEDYKRNKQAGAPKRWKDRRIERDGEKIGGGFFIFRRGRDSGRIRMPQWPFEHPSIEAARTEQARLSVEYPDETFVIVQEVRA